MYFGALVIVGVIWLIGYSLHLRFGRDVLRETKNSASLKDAAEYTRGYRSANVKSMMDAITKFRIRKRDS